MALFDLELIRKAFFKDQAYENGLKLLDHVDIDIIDITTDKFTDDKTLVAQIHDQDQSYQTSICLKQKGNSATLSGERSCNCSYYLDHHENCQHMAALINYLQPYDYNELTLERLNSNESSSELVELIDDYKRQLVSRIEHNVCRLTPQLALTENGFKLTFFINKKYSPSYVIQDLRQFLDLFKTRGVYAYSSTSEIIHDMSLFTPMSQTVIRVLDNNRHLISDDGSSFNLTPDLYFVLFSHDLELRLEQKDEVIRHLHFVKTNHPFTLSVRQSGDLVKIKLLSNQTDLIHVNNCYMWLVGNEIYYFLNEDNQLQKLLDLLVEKQLQLSVTDYLKFKIFVESRIGEDLGIDENVDLDFSDLGLEDIVLNFDYQQDNIIIHMPQLSFLSNGDFTRNIDYIKLIKIYQLLSTISVKEGDLLIIKRVEDMYQLFTRYYDIISTISNNITTTDNFNKLEVIEVNRVNIDVDSFDSDLILDIKIKGLTQNEIQSLLTNVNQRKMIVKLGHKIVNLNNQAFFALLQLCDFLVLDQSDLSKLVIDPTKLFLLENIGESFTDIDFHFSASVIERLSEIKDFKTGDFNPNELINCELRDYQVEGINYILSLMELNYGAILADEMGLGKTIQALAVANYYIKQNKRILITAPTSLIYNWHEEILRFLKTPKTLLIIGDVAARCKLINQIDQYDIILTSYDLLKRDRELYNDYVFDLFILDESQFIKNFNTQNYSAITGIKAKHHLALTGTPIENGVKDLWSIINFAIPGYLGNYRSFYRFFEQPIMMGNDDTRLLLLKKVTAPFIIRRLKKDVLQALPTKEESIIYNHMNQKQSMLYQEYIVKYQQEIANNDQLSKVELLSMIMRLRQIAIDPRLIDDNYASGEKINSLKSIILECVGKKEKVLVFSQFVKMLDLITLEMNDLGIDYLILTGKTSKEQRQEMVKRFSEDGGPYVFFISLKAGGTGLNLTSANHVVLVDPWWNKSVENQAADRAHRIGQKKDVYVNRLITLDSIEDRIMDIQYSKTALSQNLLSNEITSLEFLDIDELKDLIR